jgi:ATP-dependent RNA helicase DeaD
MSESTSAPLFSDLGLSSSTLTALEKKGFESPSEIQSQIIPICIQSDKDIIGQAQTGTGKTAAFGIPLVELLEESQSGTQALVLTPTRELAIQVSEEIQSFLGQKKLSLLPVYGGQSITEQLKRLKKKTDIVVGTPGRVMDHIRRGTLKLDFLTHMVLDEADEMLNMGFIEDIEFIFEQANPNKRVFLFSATMPPEILKISKKYMGDFEKVSIKRKQLTTEQTEQIYFEVRGSDKFEALCRIVDVEDDFYGIVFCRTKVDVDEITSRLSDRGYDVAGLHGDVSQSTREKKLKLFRNKNINILVATDVAARGIDVQNLTHVINHSLPQNPEAYVHRIGRTGRAGQEGTAITFITPSEYRKLTHIEKKTQTKIQKKQIPGAEEIIEKKIVRIQEAIRESIESTAHQDYSALAQTLLQQGNPEDVLAALLHSQYHSKLDVSQYKDITSFSKKDRKKRGGDSDSHFVDEAGTTRLFVAMGKKDGMTPRKLVQHLEAKTNVFQKRMQDVQIFDTFSFITAPFRDAEIILKAFKNQGTGKKRRQPLVTRAQKEQGESRGRRQRKKVSGKKKK